MAADSGTAKERGGTVLRILQMMYRDTTGSDGLLGVRKSRLVRWFAAGVVMVALGAFCLHSAAAEDIERQEMVAGSKETSVWLTEGHIKEFMDRLEDKDEEKAVEMRALLKDDPKAFEVELQQIEHKWFKGDIREMAFGAIGGLGLFLFGMGMMSEGLKKAAGQKLKRLLEMLTKRRVIAVMVGAATTCLVQSSSAATVMTVGFVNAGLLTLKQALPVVLGANIGTTFTAWMVSAFAVFKVSSYALPFVGVGFLLTLAGRTQKSRSLGEVMLGFGILFVGIGFMKDAFEPLEFYSGVQAALIWLGGNPVLAVLAGAIITMLLQSSSASIAMVQTLAFAGAFGTDNWVQTLQITIPFILGTNIGTTITAQLAALRASRNAKRAAMGHTIFNALGVLYMLPLVWGPLYAHAVEWIVRVLTPLSLNQNTIMVHIAVAHTAFNVFNTLIFLPLIGTLAAIAFKILPVTEKESARRPVALEEHLLDTPSIALQQSEREIVRMAKAARRAVEAAINGILRDDRKALASANELEDFTDEFQLAITTYLTTLSQKQLSGEVSIKLPVLLHTVNDLERIGDHAVNITEIAQRKIDGKLSFTEAATEEAKQLKKEVLDMFDSVLAALSESDLERAKAGMANEQNLNRMQVEFRRSHVERMGEGVCTAEAGLIFIDLVDNVEKIGDHLTNIVQAVVGGLQWAGTEPEKKKDASEQLSKGRDSGNVDEGRWTVDR